MIRRTLALAGVIGAVACAPAVAAPTTVDLRVEGATQTLFEGPVTTDARVIDEHRCDGTNAGSNPTPGPTMFSALHDSGLAWERTWNANFDDFFLDAIGPDRNADDFSTFWGYYLNWRSPNKGGCQQQVAAGQRVLFAYGSFGEPLLQLGGPTRAAVGEPVALRVTEVDGDTGETAPSQGAAVAGATTGADGTAQAVFTEPGRYSLKATKDNAIRSNQWTVCVYVRESGGCDVDPAPDPTAPAAIGADPAPDTTAPVATISGIADGRTYRRSPRELSGRVTEDRGIHQVYLRVRMVDRRGCRWLSGRREAFTRPRSCDRARYIRLGDDAEWSYLLPVELEGGARYIVDVKVLDRWLNRTLEQVRFRVAR